MMALVDTSVWVDFLRSGDDELTRSLEEGGVMIHRLVIEELACGNLRPRDEVLTLLEKLPKAQEAGHHELLHFLDAHKLPGTGIGVVDAHLLAAAMLSRVKLWTKDAAMARAADRVGLETI